jgi:hypothetical protein
MKFAVLSFGIKLSILQVPERFNKNMST